MAEALASLGCNATKGIRAPACGIGRVFKILNCDAVAEKRFAEDRTIGSVLGRKEVPLESSQVLEVNRSGASASVRF